MFLRLSNALITVYDPIHVSTLLKKFVVDFWICEVVLVSQVNLSTP